MSKGRRKKCPREEKYVCDSACLNTHEVPSSISNKEETKITNQRDDWLMKCELLRKKGHLRKALKNSSLMKGLRLMSKTRTYN